MQAPSRRRRSSLFGEDLSGTRPRCRGWQERRDLDLDEVGELLGGLLVTGEEGIRLELGLLLLGGSTALAAAPAAPLTALGGTVAGRQQRKVREPG